VLFLALLYARRMKIWVLVAVLALLVVVLAALVLATVVGV
jgi:hypothetical protein